MTKLRTEVQGEARVGVSAMPRDRVERVTQAVDRLEDTIPYL
jgi:hypothetical protein